MKATDSRYRECLYFSSNAFARKVEKLASSIWKKVDMSPSHAYLLMLAIDDPGIQPSTIVKQLLLTPSTITRLIEKLEEKKLLVRTTEGKLTNIYPTPKGKSLAPQLLACVQEFNEAYTTILGKEESSRMVNTINKLSDKLPD
ncbi:MAG: MarR family transcriptional regulator [Chitinophagaceae bacterium]|nr:MAG: MarR family transcriptional regulator [Chitinophagaceae bacterium]